MTLLLNKFSVDQLHTKEKSEQSSGQPPLYPEKNNTISPNHRYSTHSQVRKQTKHPTQKTKPTNKRSKIPHTTEIISACH
jgi:hypothetical protein